MRYGYTRVSTLEQAQGTSLDEQANKIRWVADAGKGHQIDEIFTDPGVSGSTTLRDRPAGARLLEVLKPSDTIYAAKLDRIFRSASDALVMAEEFQKKGIDIVIADIGSEPVTQNGASKMFFGMLALMAEFERSRILERINDGKTAKKAKNGFTGGKRPFGYQIIGKGKEAMLIEDESEQKALKRMKTLRKNGLSFMAIANELKASGFTISHMSVKNILDRG